MGKDHFQTTSNNHERVLSCRRGSAAWPFFVSVILMIIILGEDMPYISMIEVIIQGLWTLFDHNYIPRYPESERFLTFSLLTAIAVIACFVMIWVTGIRLLKQQKYYDFPLNRIAWSSMICIPLTIITIFSTGEYADNSLIWQAILMLPYIFLFIHFYNADRYDATPD